MYYYGGDVQSTSTTSSLTSATTVQLIPLGQRVRLRTVVVTAGTANIALVNGSPNGSDNVFNIVMGAVQQNPFHLAIPGHGVLFDNGIGIKGISADQTINAGGFCIFYEG